MVTTIQTFDISKLKHAEHVQLHTNIRNTVEKAGSEELGLSDLVYGPYRRAISAEQDIVNKAAGSAFTQEMNKADENRCRAFRLVMSRLALGEFAVPDSEVARLFPLVKKALINPYALTDVMRLPVQERTSTFTGFILDCRTQLSDEEIATLGIEDDLDELESANQKFTTTYQQRVSEKASGSSIISSELRSQTDEAFLQFALALNFLGNDPTPAKKAQVEACQKVIGEINVMISEAKARIAQRYSGLACVIEAVNFEHTTEMPALLNDEPFFRIIGKKLQVKKIRLSMIAQLPDQLPVSEEAWLEDFLTTYGAKATTAKDPLTGFEVMTIQGWQLGDKQLTLEKVE